MRSIRPPALTARAIFFSVFFCAIAVGNDPPPMRCNEGASILSNVSMSRSIRLTFDGPNANNSLSLASVGRPVSFSENEVQVQFDEQPLVFGRGGSPPYLHPA